MTDFKMHCTVQFCETIYKANAKTKTVAIARTKSCAPLLPAAPSNGTGGAAMVAVGPAAPEELLDADGAVVIEASVARGPWQSQWSP
jgi:hypothetical protein